MQTIGGSLNSRTARWVMLLVFLLGIYIYIQLSPSSQSTEPTGISEIKEIHDFIKKKFVPVINHIGAQQRVKTENDAPPVVQLQTPGPTKRNGGRTTTTFRPVTSLFGQARRSTVIPRLTDPSGYVPASSGATGTLPRTVTSSGLAISDIPAVHVREVNCARIVAGDPEEISKAERYQDAHPKVPVPERAFLNMARDCPRFKKERGYLTKAASIEEASFPIAYSIMMFKDVEQTERLLRAIYRPQNYYCIHVDKKSPLDTHRTLEAVAKCFDNVFLAPRAVDVQWAWYSVLEPDLICMEHLFKRAKNWRYFINLTGQEFPLKTNLDLVRILRVFNGSNSVEGTRQRRNTDRTEYVHNGFMPTEKRKSSPPEGVVITKGSVHITASRAFVDFILNNPTALKFREWVKDSGVPDETFFTSLNHSPKLGVPGAYKGEPETDPLKYPFIARFKNWGVWPFDYPCSGQRVRMVCVFGIGDVSILSHRPELFANKFYLDYNPLALDCLEELHYNRTRQELQGTLSFNTAYYKSLNFVKNHV